MPDSSHPVATVQYNYPIGPSSYNPTSSGYTSQTPTGGVSYVTGTGPYAGISNAGAGILNAGSNVLTPQPYQPNQPSSSSALNPATEAVNTQAPTATQQVQVNQQLASRSAELGRSLSQAEIMQYAGVGYVGQQADFYGTRNNLTPDQQAYYGKIQTGEIQPRANASSISTANIQPKTLPAQQMKDATSETIYQKQISTYNGIPTYQIRVKDSTGADRLASADEQQYFLKNNNVLQASSGKGGLLGNVKSNQAYQNIVYGIDKAFNNVKSSPLISMGVAGTKELNSQLVESMNLPKGDIIFGTSVQQNEAYARLQKEAPILSKIGIPILRTEVGLGRGLYEDVRTQPLKNVVLFGLGKYAGEIAGVASTAVKEGEVANYLKNDLGLLKPTSNVIEREISTGVMSVPKTTIAFDEATGKISYGLGKGIKTGVKVGVGVGLLGYNVYKDISSSASYEEAVGKIGVSAKDILLFGAGYTKGNKLVSEPIITKEIPQQEISKYVEKQTLYSVNDKYQTFSKYQIETGVIPKQIEISNKAKVFLGQEPIKELFPIAEPYKVTTITPFEAKSGEPFSTIDLGQRYKTISIVSGTAEPIDLRSSYPEKLSRIDKRLVQELSLGEEWKLTGKGFEVTKGLRNVDSELVLKNLPRDAQYMEGLIEKERLWTSQKGLLPYGKRTTLTKYIGKFEEVPLSEASKFEVTKGKLVFKDVTKPFARSSGRIQSMEGFTIMNKEPIVIKSGTYFEPFPNEIKANAPSISSNVEKDIASFSNEPLQQKVVQIQKLEPRVITPPKVRLVQMSRETKLLLKEPTTSFVRTAVKGNSVQRLSRDFNKLSGLNDQGSLSKSVSKSLSYTMPSLSEKTIQTSQEKSLTKGMNKLIEKNLMKEIVREQPKLQERTMQKQLQKQQEKLMQKQMERIIEKPPYQPPTKRYYYNNYPNIPIEPWPTIGKRSSKSLKSFDVFIIENRQKRFVAKGVSKGEALDIGTVKTLGSLRATFGLSESKLPLKDVSTGGEFERYAFKFRKPTTKSYLKKFGGDLFVQKQSGAGGRLFSSGERNEIQNIKRIKMEQYLR